MRGNKISGTEISQQDDRGLLKVWYFYFMREEMIETESLYLCKSKIFDLVLNIHDCLESTS